MNLINLNEECLLHFLQQDVPAGMADASDGNATTVCGSLTGELKRIFRNRQYVSFPQAILLRRVDRPPC